MTGPMQTTKAQEERCPSAPSILPRYAFLAEKNKDLFGWVRIAGTKLDYPVMYTPEEPEYYLRRAFDCGGNCDDDGDLLPADGVAGGVEWL